MKKTYFLLISAFILISTIAYAEKAYILELSNIDNTITYSSVKVTDSIIPEKYVLKDSYSAELIDFSDTTTYKTSFSPAGYGPFTLTLPYKTDAKEIIIRNPSNEELLRIPVLQFADTCNNAVCEPSESYETCPEDCPSGGKDDYCDGNRDHICDPDCTEEADPDCLKQVKEEIKIPEPEKIFEEEIEFPSEEEKIKKGSNTLTIILISALALVIIFIISIIVLKTRSKFEEKSRVRDYIAEYLRQGYDIQQIKQGLINRGYNPKEIDEIIKKLYK